MKSYPSIEYHNKGKFGQTCFAFDKIDGSSFRAQFNHKRGFYKFGTRNTIIDKNNNDFADAIDIFLNKYSESLSKIFFTKEFRNSQDFIVYGEYYGENSFAGRHRMSDKKDIIIFDINQYKKGFLPPLDFIDKFGHTGIPSIIYHGEYNNELIDGVRENKYNLSEGVICKGCSQKNIWMSKIKTKNWLSRVKELHGEKYLLEELNNDKSLMI